jgi:pyruvate dehydrogenase E1 component alpha subunit
VRTYRLTGHTASDPAAYRLQSEVDDRRALEPIARLRAQLLQQPGITSTMLDEAAGDIRAAVAEAYADARDAPYPAAATAFEDVQDLGDPRKGAY